MSQVIYSRVPDEVKDAADAYAAEKGATLSNAIVDLLERGLTAASNEVSIAALEARLSETSAACGQLEAQLRAAKTELAAVQALGQRATQPVGNCPRCSGAITGLDVFSAGRCASCGQGLSELLTPSPQSKGLDQKEFLLLMGALGAVVAIALVAGS